MDFREILYQCSRSQGVQLGTSDDDPVPYTNLGNLKDFTLLWYGAKYRLSLSSQNSIMLCWLLRPTSQVLSRDVKISVSSFNVSCTSPCTATECTMHIHSFICQEIMFSQNSSHFRWKLSAAQKKTS